MDDWFNDRLLDDSDLQQVKNNIFKLDLPDRLGIDLHDEMQGVHLRQLQYQRLKLAYYESRYYKRMLQKWLGPVDRTKPIMDLGAGDGRFTELLLNMGFNRIIATDSNIENLHSLAEFVEELGAQDKVRLIQCDVLDTPIKSGTLAAILCIGVLYYLDEDYEKGLEFIASLLVRGGVLMEAEPDLEGQAMKALLFDDLDLFVEMVESHRFTEVYEGRLYKLRLFDREEMRRSFEKAGIELIDWHGLSSFPLMLVLARARGLVKEEDIVRLEKGIDMTLDYFDDQGGLYNHIIWLGRRR